MGVIRRAGGPDRVSFSSDGAYTHAVPFQFITTIRTRQKSLHIHSVRAGRSKPGLQPQHLAGCRLVAEIGGATLRNDFQGR